MSPNKSYISGLLLIIRENILKNTFIYCIFTVFKTFLLILYIDTFGQTFEKCVCSILEISRSTIPIECLINVPNKLNSKITVAHSVVDIVNYCTHLVI